jgi:hypothetical protein
MKRIATTAGVLLVFGLLLLALSNMDHRSDRNVPGATTTVGKSSLADTPDRPTGQAR